MAWSNEAMGGWLRKQPKPSAPPDYGSMTLEDLVPLTGPTTPTVNFMNDPAAQTFFSKAFNKPPPTTPRATTEEDYQRAVLTNPMYLQTKADIAAQRTAAGNYARDAFRRAVMDLGFVPEGFQDKYGWIDDSLRQTAEAGTKAGVSQLARIQQAHKDIQRKAMARRAAAGTLRSGGTGFDLDRAGQQHRINLYDTTSKFLDAVNTGVVKPFLESLSALSAQEREAMFRVMDMLRQSGLLSEQQETVNEPPAPPPPSAPTYGTRPSGLPGGVARAWEELGY